MPLLSTPLRPAAPARLRLFALVSALAALSTQPAQAQAQHRSVDLGFSYAQQQSKFVGSSSTNNISLRGATLDLGYALWRDLGVAIAANGLGINSQQPSIDIQEASFMIGPRYTLNLLHSGSKPQRRRVGVFADGKFGFTFATSGLYPTGTSDLASHAAGFTYSVGGGVNLRLYRCLDARVAQLDYVQSHLPNGGTNQQNNLRFSAGLNLHFGH